jgi:hypothetical protein
MTRIWDARVCFASSSCAKVRATVRNCDRWGKFKGRFANKGWNQAMCGRFKMIHRPEREISNDESQYNDEFQYSESARTKAG